jgi:hypothetical protein
MPLTADEIFVMREWLGATPSDGELSSTFDLLGGYDATVRYYLNQRLVTLATEPGSISVPGLSVSHSTAFQALQALIDRFENGGGTGLDDSTTYGMAIYSVRRDFIR